MVKLFNFCLYNTLEDQPSWGLTRYVIVFSTDPACGRTNWAFLCELTSRARCHSDSGSPLLGSHAGKRLTKNFVNTQQNYSTCCLPTKVNLTNQCPHTICSCVTQRRNDFRIWDTKLLYTGGNVTSERSIQAICKSYINNISQSHCLTVINEKWCEHIQRFSVIIVRNWAFFRFLCAG